MADLFWPGDERAGDLLSDTALVLAMVDVEQAWLACLVDAGIAPATIAVPGLRELVWQRHVERLANESEVGGNPAMALVSLLRDGLAAPPPTPPGGCTAG